VVGNILREEDMPFTGQGITPDIVINPNALPSRMTINMLLEMLCGKVGCFSGEISDASAFEHDGEKLVKELGNELQKIGYNKMGTETMYNGFTGEPFKVKIYIGPAYYQRLKHLVMSKIHSRSYGNVQLLSRQPCAGRAREGGLKYGEINYRSQWCVMMPLVFVAAVAA
jgi:DNA-directed RNA polymerase beta subunit